VKTPESVGEQNWYMMKPFAKDLISRIPLGMDKNLVSIVVFSTESVIELKLGDLVNYNDVERLIENLAFIGDRTNITGVMRTLYKEVFVSGYDRLYAQHVAILVTDGSGHTEQEHFSKEARLAKEHGIKMFGIGVGHEASMYTLSSVISLPNYHFIFILKDFNDLLKVITMNEVFASLWMVQYPQPHSSIERLDVKVKDQSCCLQGYKNT
jgi:hypothetical protein